MRDLSALQPMLRRTQGLRAALIESAFGRPPSNDLGVRLDPDSHALARINERIDGQPPETRPLAELRSEARWLWSMTSCGRRSLPEVRALALPGPAGTIPARLYRGGGPGPQPILVYLHGGGFVLGNLDSHDHVCRLLADELGCVVVSVDYRLAPEHPYPAGLDDAHAAFTWIRDHAEELGGRGSAAVAIAGDSAGGNLATLVCLRCRDAGEATPALQALVYPCTDLRRRMPSHERFARGYVLSGRKIAWFMGCYLEDPQLAADPRVSPLLHPDLSGLPPAIVLTAGFDPLRDEGLAYAEALAAAGVEVEQRLHARLLHGFLNMGRLVPAAHAASLAFVDGLRPRLHALGTGAARA